MKLRLCVLGAIVACSANQASEDAGADAAADVTVDTASSDVSIPDSGGDIGNPGDSGVVGFGGPSKCGGGAFRLCDGFEGSSIDTTLWAAPIINNATVKIDTTHVARGASALYVHTGLGDAGDPAGTVGNLHTTHGFPFPNDDVWGRVFVYMANQSPDMHTNMVEAVGTLPGDAGESHYRIGVSTGHVIAGNYIPGDYADHSTTVMPLDQWVCFEWHFDGKNSEYHFYLNGGELTDMAILADASPVDRASVRLPRDGAAPLPHADDHPEPRRLVRRDRPRYDTRHLRELIMRSIRSWANRTIASCSRNLVAQRGTWVALACRHDPRASRHRARRVRSRLWVEQRHARRG